MRGRRRLGSAHFDINLYINFEIDVDNDFDAGWTTLTPPVRHGLDDYAVVRASATDSAFSGCAASSASPE